MKKIFLGSLVGAILLFGWQSLSWTVLGIHEKAMSYTPAQDSLLNTLSNTLKQEARGFFDRNTLRIEETPRPYSPKLLKPRLLPSPTSRRSLWELEFLCPAM